jgi:Protein kinase domain
MRKIEAGDEIAGYRIEGVAGRGGMGVVYRAVQLALDRRVALKVIAPEYAADAEFRRRFERESRMAGSIRHPNVITIYDAREEDGLLFITMDYIEGTDLRTVLSERGRLDPARATDLVGQVASALDAAHARGLVHRDVKPANVLLASEDGGEHAYLTDFGLSKTAGMDSSLTQAGAMIGTTDYAAPEQLEGEPVDARADVYSLTCVLFQALTGRVPFERDKPAATIFAHISAEPPSVREVAPDLPAELDEVIGRGMAKRPSARYLSAGDLATAAKAAAVGGAPAVEERSVAVGEAATAEPAPRRRFPGRTLAVVLAGATAVLAVVLLASGVLSGDSSDAPGNPAGQVAGQPIRVIPGPTAIDFGDGGVWIGGDERRPRVVRVDARSETVGDPIRVARPPLELFVGAGAVWANTLDSITRIDLRTRRSMVIRPPGPIPRSSLEGGGQSPLAIAVGGGAVWVANSVDGTVTRLDARSNRLGRPIRVGRGLGPIAFARGAVFVGVGRTLRVIDPESERIQPGQVVRMRNRVLELEVAGDTVFAIEQDRAGRSLGEPVDAATGIVGRAIRAREGPADFVVGDNSGWISYAPEGTVDRIELVDRKRVGSPIRLARGASILAFGQGSLWAANFNAGTLTRIKPG